MGSVWNVEKEAVCLLLFRRVWGACQVIGQLGCLSTKQRLVVETRDVEFHSQERAVEHKG